jgi:RNA polymerase sigma-70 factor (ECF subfamily)
VLGEFEADLDQRQVAMKHFRKALELATMKSEQAFLTRKIQELNDTATNEAQAPRRQNHAF